jgi:hypothetical protein
MTTNYIFSFKGTFANGFPDIVENVKTRLVFTPAEQWQIMLDSDGGRRASEGMIMPVAYIPGISHKNLCQLSAEQTRFLAVLCERDGIEYEIAEATTKNIEAIEHKF